MIALRYDSRGGGFGVAVLAFIFMRAIQSDDRAFIGSGGADYYMELVGEKVFILLAVARC